MRATLAVIRGVVLAIIWCLAVVAGVLIGICGAAITASQNVPRI